MNRKCFVVLALLLTLSLSVLAQKKQKAVIHIVHSNLVEYNDALGKNVQRLIGNVVLRQDSTCFYSDSAYLNDKTHNFNGFGNVHIALSDSLDIYGNLLDYQGETKVGELFHQVRLTDDSTLIETEHMIYNRLTKIASYPDFGTITRGEKKLVSKKGFYNTDNKTLRFYHQVVVTSPENQIFTDTLYYFTDQEMMFFYGPTVIVNKKDTIFGNYGTYDAAHNTAFLDKGATLKNENQQLIADSMFYDRNINFVKAMGNVSMQDTANKIKLDCGYGEFWKSQGRTVATDSILLTYYQDSDSLYLSSDTLQILYDTVSKRMSSFKAYYQVRFFRNDLQGKADSLNFVRVDSMIYMRKKPVLWMDSSQMTARSIDIFMSDKNIDSIKLLSNALIIMRDSIDGYNQIKASTIVNQLKNNDLKSIHSKGDAKLIFYVREDNGSLTGINVANAAAMSFDTDNGKIDRIKYYQKADEILYPEKDITPSISRVTNFEWLDSIRPHSTIEVFSPKRKIPLIPQVAIDKQNKVAEPTDSEQIVRRRKKK